MSDVGLALDRAAGAARALGDRVPRLPLLLRRRPRLAALRRRRRARRRPGRRARAGLVVQPARGGAAPRGRGGGSLRRRRRRGQRRYRAGVGASAVGAPGDGRGREPADAGGPRLAAGAGARGPRDGGGHRRRARGAPSAAGRDAERRLLQPAHRPCHASRTRLGQLLPVRGIARAGRAVRPREDRLGGRMPRLKLGFIPIEGGHYYKEALEEVTRAEELGFDSVWMEEHHAVTNHYWPSPFPVLAGFATRTSKVMLGTDIAVAAFYHPVRLAEDVAMLDVMSNGRITLGVAIGYKPDEFALYGVDLEKRGARFEHQLAIMKGLWTQETVSFKGTYYTVDGRIEPKPVTKPHPPVWIGGWGDITLRRAATLADNWIPGPTADLARLVKGKEQFLANRRAARRMQPIAEWPLTRDLIIAETDKQARALADEHIMVAYRREYAGGWRHPFI